MKVFGVTLGDRIKRLDPIIFGATAFLSLVSILTIFGSVENFGKIKLIMQLAMTALGIFLAFILANFDYRFFIDRFYVVLFLGSVLLLALTLLVGISGTNIETANRSWITLPFIGIAVQPSEFIKLTFLCTFSKHIDMVKDKINRPPRTAHTVFIILYIAPKFLH